ncbi:hypothetical protein BIFBRE_05098 [Bifidobacterium breve DSM 20213 = JCM 1192]|uniref:Uncharacterized protein n=1 Tax=Bifidobacterium breve DSM 20213 = JCM 1192 TaxID=518634 RepID=D4BSK6_BIFBR|nr:hypothetical protein BIFBRE_05098 [Bifidobacterium breve DSM 20213 = JCM 1192]
MYKITHQTIQCKAKTITIKAANEVVIPQEEEEEDEVEHL